MKPGEIISVGSPYLGRKNGRLHSIGIGMLIERVANRDTFAGGGWCWHVLINGSVETWHEQYIETLETEPEAGRSL